MSRMFVSSRWIAHMHCCLPIIIDTLKYVSVSRTFAETTLAEIEIRATCAVKPWAFNRVHAAAITPIMSTDKINVLSIVNN